MEHETPTQLIEISKIPMLLALLKVVLRSTNIVIISPWNSHLFSYSVRRHLFLVSCAAWERFEILITWAIHAFLPYTLLYNNTHSWPYVDIKP